MRVLITGATKGIGRGIAEVLAGEGFSLGLLARSGDLLDTLRAELLPARVVTAVCDLRDPAATAQAVEELLSDMDGVDALINNAGVVIRKSIWELAPEEWQMMIETNLNAVFTTTQTVLRHMKNQGHGRILQISSISGRLPLPGGCGYAASKFGVTGFSESLFGEVRDHNIHVCTIFPGSVETEPGAQDPGWKLHPHDVGRACLAALTSSPGACLSRIEVRPLQRPQ